MSGLSDHHSIKPATPPFAACYRAKFAAAFAHTRAISTKIFGRKRAAADAGCIGFGNAKHKADIGWADTGACCRLPGNGVAGGDKRIGAVINIEHDPLCPFKQNTFIRRPCIGQIPPALPGKS